MDYRDGKSYSVKTNPSLGSPRAIFGYDDETGESVIWLFLNINLSTTISMKRSRRELSIDVVSSEYL